MVFMGPKCPVLNCSCKTAYDLRRCRCAACCAHKRERHAKYRPKKRISTTPECPVYNLASSTAHRHRGCRCDVCRSYAAHLSRLYRQRRKPEVHPPKPDPRSQAEQRERRLAHGKAYRAKNRDRLNQATKEWKARNADMNKEALKNWRANNPDRVAGHHRRRRARKQSAGGAHTPEDVRLLYQRQRGKCFNCNARLASGYHVDHIQPLSRGGTDDPVNLQLLCPFCNMSKGSRDPIEWAQANGRLL